MSSRSDEDYLNTYFNLNQLKPERSSMDIDLMSEQARNLIKSIKRKIMYQFEEYTTHTIMCSPVWKLTLLVVIGNDVEEVQFYRLEDEETYPEKPFWSSPFRFDYNNIISFK